MIINLELKDKWLSYAGGKPCFLLVGDNEDYSIHFDTDLNKLLIYNGEKWVDTNGNEQ